MGTAGSRQSGSGERCGCCSGGDEDGSGETPSRVRSNRVSSTGFQMSVPPSNPLPASSGMGAERCGHAMCASALMGLNGAGKTSLLFSLQHPQPLERHRPDPTARRDHFSPAVCDNRYSHDDASKWSTDSAAALGNLGPPPTPTFQHVRIEINREQVTVVDFPGRASARAGWPAALQPCDAAVMVLDAAVPGDHSDHRRIHVAREELSLLVDTIRARQLPLLLLVNKHDLADAASVEDVSAIMAQVLSELRRDGCATAVAACCAHDTASVQTALEWVCARRGHRSGVGLGQGSGC